MLSARLKGFILGAVAMVITPALAIPEAPRITTPKTGAIAEDAQLFQLQKADAEAAIAHALSERGAGGKVAASINSRTAGPIFSHNKPISVEIRGLRFDALTHSFSANLLAIADNAVLSAAPISGRFDVLVEVPVLKRTMRAGETIAADDIELRDYPTGRTRQETITDIASLIGKSPERTISEGRPIREHELAQATLVKRNDMVKMHYNQNGIEISTSGQALADGGKGAVIAVRNLTSKKSIQATVTGENSVMVLGDNVNVGQANTGANYETN